MRPWLARRAGSSYPERMTALRIVFIVLAASFIACDTPHRVPPKKPVKKSSNSRSGAQGVVPKTEHAFRHVGGKLENFFTGHDTISR